MDRRQMFVRDAIRRRKASNKRNVHPNYTGEFWRPYRAAAQRADLLIPSTAYGTYFMKAHKNSPWLPINRRLARTLEVNFVQTTEHGLMPRHPASHEEWKGLVRGRDNLAKRGLKNAHNVARPKSGASLIPFDRKKASKSWYAITNPFRRLTPRSVGGGMLVTK